MEPQRAVCGVMQLWCPTASLVGMGVLPREGLWEEKDAAKGSQAGAGEAEQTVQGGAVGAMTREPGRVWVVASKGVGSHGSSLFFF